MQEEIYSCTRCNREFIWERDGLQCVVCGERFCTNCARWMGAIPDHMPKYPHWVEQGFGSACLGCMPNKELHDILPKVALLKAHEEHWRLVFEEIGIDVPHNTHAGIGVDHNSGHVIAAIRRMREGR